MLWLRYKKINFVTILETQVFSALWNTEFFVLFQYNPVCDLVVSSDLGGMVEFWTGPKGDYKFSKNLEWEYKTETDWYEFVKVKVFLTVNMLANFACFFVFCSDFF